MRKFTPTFMRSFIDFDFVNMAMIPLFLFSATFFPITQLPAWLRPVAYVTPLWNGVALCRSLSLGTATLGGALIHVGYLAGLAAIGVAVGNRTYRRRLYV